MVMPSLPAVLVQQADVAGGRISSLTPRSGLAAGERTADERLPDGPDGRMSAALITSRAADITEASKYIRRLGT
jgi:hypothetical protein